MGKVIFQTKEHTFNEIQNSLGKAERKVGKPSQGKEKNLTLISLLLGPTASLLFLAVWQGLLFLNILQNAWQIPFCCPVHDMM